MTPPFMEVAGAAPWQPVHFGSAALSSSPAPLLPGGCRDEDAPSTGCSYPLCCAVMGASLEGMGRGKAGG